MPVVNEALALLDDATWFQVEIDSSFLFWRCLLLFMFSPSPLKRAFLKEAPW